MTMSRQIFWESSLVSQILEGVITDMVAKVMPVWWKQLKKWSQWQGMSPPATARGRAERKPWGLPGQEVQRAVKTLLWWSCRAGRGLLKQLALCFHPRCCPLIRNSDSDPVSIFWWFLLVLMCFCGYLLLLMLA